MPLAVGVLVPAVGDLALTLIIQTSSMSVRRMGIWISPGLRGPKTSDSVSDYEARFLQTKHDAVRLLKHCDLHNQTVNNCLGRST